MKAEAVFLSLAIVACSQPLIAHAHQAPSGWEYDLACCHNRDCAPIRASAVRAGPDGLTITVRGGTHMMVPAGETFTETVPYRDPRVKPSGDDDWHVCIIAGRIRCLYQPPGGV